MEEERRTIYNAIQTPDGTILHSKHRHDFVEYTDKNGQYYANDGGNDYSRRLFDVSDYKDISIVDDGTFETRSEFAYMIILLKFINKKGNITGKYKAIEQKI